MVSLLVVVHGGGLHACVCCLIHAGDDMVPRSSPSSLRRLEKRLVEFVPKGDGTGAAAFDYAR